MLSSRCQGPTRTVVLPFIGLGLQAPAARSAAPRSRRSTRRVWRTPARTARRCCNLRPFRLSRASTPCHRAPRPRRAAERGGPEPRRRVDEVLIVRIDDALAHPHTLAVALGDEAAPQVAVGIALQLRLLDAVTQAAKTIAGRMQRARRLRHVAQHPHAAVGREATDVSGKRSAKRCSTAVSASGRSVSPCQTPRPLVRRRSTRGVGMAATGQRPQRAGQQHEHHAARPLLGEPTPRGCQTRGLRMAHARSRCISAHTAAHTAASTARPIASCQTARSPVRPRLERDQHAVAHHVAEQHHRADQRQRGARRRDRPTRRPRRSMQAVK